MDRTLFDEVDGAKSGVVAEAEPVGVHPRDYQSEAVDAVFEEWKWFRSTLVILGTGAGKCLAEGTPVLMIDGTVKAVEDVAVGDRLVGPDSAARVVVSLASGSEMMYRVTPTKGDPFVVNESHMLSVKISGVSDSDPARIENLTVADYVSRSKKFKHVARCWRSGVEWPHRDVPLDPYFLGLWLGDGSMLGVAISKPDPEAEKCCRDIAAAHGLRVRECGRSYGKCPTWHIVGTRRDRNPVRAKLEAMGVTSGKHVPLEYKVNSREVRLEVLAGMLDSDGHMTRGGFDWISKDRRLACDIVFLCRSLGLAAYMTSCRKGCQGGFVGDYFRVTISGDCSVIPNRIPRKKAPPRLQVKDVLVTGMTVEPVGVGRYYGFEIRGPDRLFLLGDFTVTHNTVISMLVAKRVLEGECGPGGFLFVTNRDSLVRQSYRQFRAAFPTVRVEVEQADRYATEKARIVIASVHTIGKASRCERFARDRFACANTDEAHRSVTANKLYKKIDDWFLTASVLGQTATPDRGDGVGLKCMFQSVAYRKDLLETIRDGWLVPLRQVVEYCEGVTLPEKAGGADWTPEELEKALLEEGARGLWQIAEAAVKWADFGGKKRRCVVFTPGVDSAILVRDIINRRAAKGETGRAAVIHHRVDPHEREQLEAAYRRGEIQYLVNNACLTEGFDDDGTAVIVIGRQTKRRGTYSQMAGRSTRVLESIRIDLSRAGSAERRREIIAASAKPGALIVDMVATSHKLTFNCMDLLAGSKEPGTVLRAKKNAVPGKVLDPAAALTRAEVEERESLRAKARQKIIPTVQFRTVWVDPFDVYRTTYERESPKAVVDLATAAQVATLVRFGMGDAESRRMTKMRASDVISVAIARAKAGLCGYKAARLLVSHGFDPDVTAEEAKRIISTIKAKPRKPRKQ